MVNDPKNRNQRYGLDSSLDLFDGTPLGVFVLGEDVLGPYSRIVATEQFDTVLITDFFYEWTDDDILPATEAFEAVADQVTVDDSTLFVSEEFSATSDVVLDDATSLLVTDTYTSARISVHTDTGLLTSTEEQELLGTYEFTDASTVTVEESLSISVLSFQITQSESLNAVETFFTGTAHDFVEISPLNVTESFSTFNTIELTDNVTLNSSEVYTALRTTATTDSGTLTSTEQGSLYSDLTLAVDETIYIGETVGIQGDETYNLSDGQTVTSTEYLTNFGTTSGTDAGTLTSSESATYQGFVSLPDTISFTATEDSDIITGKTLVLTDAKTIGSSESFVVNTISVFNDLATFTVIYPPPELMVFVDRTDAGPLAVVTSYEQSGEITLDIDEPFIALEEATTRILGVYIPITFIQDIIVEPGDDDIAMLRVTPLFNPTLIREVPEGMEIIQTTPDVSPSHVRTAPDEPLGIMRTVNPEMQITQTTGQNPYSYARGVTSEGPSALTVAVANPITIIHTFKGEL